MYNFYTPLSGFRLEDPTVGPVVVAVLLFVPLASIPFLFPSAILIFCVPETSSFQSLFPVWLLGEALREWLLLGSCLPNDIQMRELYWHRIREEVCSL